MLFIDIDNFKGINDSFGHDVGDSVLKHFAQRLANCVRSTERERDEREQSVCRYAGDEFIILLHGIASRDELDVILARIINLSTDFAEIEQYQLEVTFSTGVALLSEHGDTLVELINKADQAMYDAKRKGKNQYSFYQVAQVA